MLIIKLLLCVSLVNSQSYSSIRQKVLGKFNYFPGNSLNSSYVEDCFSKHLLIFKSKEINNNKDFLASQHFLHSKTSIEKSNVYKFIKSMPKGGNLHGHDVGMVSSDFLYNLTLMKNLYGCYDAKKNFHFRFMKSSEDNEKCRWKLLSEFRKDEKFNRWLNDQMLILDKPNIFQTSSKAWKKLKSMVLTMKGLITYKPNCSKHFYQILKELHEDNVQYLEFRSELDELYELNGTVLNYLETAKIYKETVDRFKKKNPTFIGAKLIYSPKRPGDNSDMRIYRKNVKQLKKHFGSFLAGFDMVGEEDVSPRINTFAKRLSQISSVTKLILHAGETNWLGNNADFNLIDAVTLKSLRIGHAYSLIYHPDLLKVVKDQKIAIELCPISNQIFSLTNQFNNHPGKILFENNIPVVIGNDYPGFWGAKGVSYDWYLVFMAMTKPNADLRFLKKIALNSLKFSAMTRKEKEKALNLWKDQWKEWLAS